MRKSQLIKPAVVILTTLAFAVGSPMQAATAATQPPQSLPFEGDSVPRVAVAALPAPVMLPSAHAVYAVAPGDTLSQIAARFCSSASAFPSLAAASSIANPDRIYPGDHIVLNCAAPPAASSRAPVAPAPVSKPAAPVQSNLASGAAVAAWALTQVGKAYLWAAAGPNAYDCSGLVVAAYARLGIRLPHQSESLMGVGRAVSRSELQPGDVIQPYVGHVMIYVGNGRVVEAANSRVGVITNSVYSFYRARRYV